MSKLQNRAGEGVEGRQLTMPATDSAHVSTIDLLSLPFAGGKGIASHQHGEFSVETPWATPYFGKLQLRRGWWRLICEGGPDSVELRLSSLQDPLVVIPARGDSMRVYLGDPTGYEISLIVSPWPGAYSFSRLRFQRLKSYETAKLMFIAAARLLRRKHPLKLLLRAARRLMAGQALGLGLPPQHPVKSGNPTSDSSTPSEVFVSRWQASDDALLNSSPNESVHRDAPAIVRAAFSRDPALKAVYSDVVEANRIVPHPEWDAVLAESGAFDGAPLFLREGVEAGSIADVFERFGPAAIGRIPLPLVSRSRVSRGRPQSRAVPELSRTPRVSAIIPTKFHVDLLQKCLNGLNSKTGYPDLEVVVVDNGVTDPRFPDILVEARKSLDLRVVEDKGSFNFSRLVNAGVKSARGEIVLLLNDDVEPIESGWLHRIVESAMSSDIGAVGARLVYPDRSVQHAGLVLGLGGTCAHLWRGLSAEAAADNLYITSPGARMAVTGACLAVRRSEFDVVGGFDEAAFPVAYNDIDFCLRLHVRGLRNIYRGDASLIHHESQSRGSDEASVATHKRQSAEAARFLQRWRHLTNSDPHFSPAFDPAVEIGRAHQVNYAPASHYREI